MSLLPKSREEFKKTEYWNNFFQKRGSQAFEWYGEYRELHSYLHKYITPKDDLLVIGCGNSSLSADLYDMGITNITNIDLSKIVIKQMLKLNKQRNDMKFLQMDVTEMTFKDASYSVVLDKGTLDALMPDTSTETLTKVNQMYCEIQRVLKNGGRYICISLLQEHIIKYLLDKFCTEYHWMFRVIRCYAAETQNSVLPVFMIIATKILRPLPIPIIEIALNYNGKVQRVDVETVLSEVRSAQDTALVCSSVGKTSLQSQEEVVLDLYANDGSSESTEPRYTVRVLDQPYERKNGFYGVFIVPQGRETEWLFATSEGRQKLLLSAGFNRLAIVTTHRGQRYGTLDDVKSELNESVRVLSPTNIHQMRNNIQIPYLSLGDDCGRRDIVYEGFSEMSGAFVVEDIYKEANEIYRRLIFLKNQSLIQSEAKMIKVVNKKNLKNKSLQVNYGYLACDHHKYMSIGVELINNNINNISAVLIGLGGGGLCSFLQHIQESIQLKAIDIDPAILQTAIDWFDLQQDSKLSVEILDGIEYVQNELKLGHKHHLFLFDVNNDDASSGISCPPKAFLEEEFLQQIKGCLTKKGMLIVNLVCRDIKLYAEVMNKLTTVFELVLSYQLEEDQNQIIYCWKSKCSDWNNQFKSSALRLNKICRKTKLLTDNLIDVDQFIKELKIHTKNNIT